MATVRIHRTYLEHLLAIAAYMRASGIGYRATVEELYRTYRNGTCEWLQNHKDRPLLGNIASSRARGMNSPYHGVQEPLDAIIDEGLDIYRPNDKKGGDLDLIEAIVGTLNLPHPRSILAGGMLEDLGRNLLSPAEQGRLANTLRSRTYHCFQCGHQFEEGEMASLVQTNRNSMEMACTNCFTPSRVICSSGKHVVSLDSPRGRKLRKVAGACLHCAEEKARREGTRGPDVVGPAIGGTYAAIERNDAPPFQPPPFRRDNRATEMLQPPARRRPPNADIPAIDARAFEEVRRTYDRMVQRELGRQQDALLPTAIPRDVPRAVAPLPIQTLDEVVQAPDLEE